MKARAFIKCKVCGATEVFSTFDGNHWHPVNGEDFYEQHKHMEDVDRSDEDVDWDYERYFNIEQYIEDELGNRIERNDLRIAEVDDCSSDRSIVVGEPYVVDLRRGK